ncbi:alpha/beta fold hydrolase [bacterium]|nr:alpha/beta fold hydrolase [bacterium]
MRRWSRWLSAPYIRQHFKNRKGDYVVLLHGIARTRRHMAPLEKKLGHAGYYVLNLNYPSTRHSLEELVEHISRYVDRHTPDKSRPVHFIGYSMGGLLVRGILNRHRPVRLGRVLLLATPNGGSEIADYLLNNPLYRHFYGPAGQQLTTRQDSLNALLGTVDYELGVIAGDATIDPICSLLIPGPNDGKVSVESTRVDGMKDHITVHASHTFFTSSTDVLEQTLYFLKHGTFRRDS